MKNIVSAIAIIHGLIHLLGFVKGFNLKHIENLTLPVSKPVAVLWLSAFILYISFGFACIYNYKFGWILGVFAVIVSQILIIMFWKDARFGSIPNLIILLFSVYLHSSQSFANRISAEITDILAHSPTAGNNTITEDDLSELPEPVKKWLIISGTLGKHYINTAKVIQKAEIKMNQKQKNWMAAQATQYTTIDKPAFIWIADVKMNRFVWFKGRDKFENGQGEMTIKINSIINIVNERGQKMNEATMQRFLGEMVWFPTMALSDYISWEQINDTTAKATMSHLQTNCSGYFYFNSSGDVIRFKTERYMGNKTDSKRLDWIMDIEDYQYFETIKVPSKMKATWKLEEGDWTWLNLEIVDIKYNYNLDKSTTL